MNKKDVCVLIPAFNEARFIRRVCQAILDLGFSLLVVDDGSSDGTANEIKDLRLQMIRSPKNEGKGASLCKGIHWFLQSDFQALVFMDGDGQHDPKELDRFVLAISQDENGVVVGNRMENPEGMPLVRRLTNRLMSWVISVVAGQSIPDSQCGYRALKRSVLGKISFSTRRFEIESEILLRAAHRGFKISSIVIHSVYQDEKSQIHPLRDALRFLVFLFSYMFSKEK